MRRSPVARDASIGSKKSGSSKDVAAAEVALKAHVLKSDPETLSQMTEGDRMMQEITVTVDLTEAPEDEVCSLVIDLLQYCERENIDWNRDVMSRAWERFRSNCAYEVQQR